MPRAGCRSAAVARCGCSSRRAPRSSGSRPRPRRTRARPSARCSPYGASKAFAHHVAGVERSRGLFTATVILYNHESPRRPTTFVTRKITSTVAAIAAGRADRLALGNLDARRDWGWAPDYVDAMVRALRHDAARRLRRRDGSGAQRP